jgi:hypothetical protein
MKILLAIALAATSTPFSPAQSVADAARANRDKPKASRIITNDDLNADKAPYPETPWSSELEQAKEALRLVCADPETHNGKNLSESDLKNLYTAARPIYNKRLALEKKLDDWQAALKKVDADEEKALIAAAPKQGFTEKDKERFLAIRDDFNSQRESIKHNAQSDIDTYEQFKKDLTEAAAVCQAAADQIK